MDLPPFALHPLSDGRFRLDGGAMFGVVPRVLWERVAPPDEAHRIDLALRPLLIEGPGRTVLVDTGMGDLWDEKGRAQFALDRADTLALGLARAGVAPADVDLVVLTHLHFDHAGGAVVRLGDGTLAPRFPNARHAVQRAEWEAANDQDGPRRASYRPETFQPLAEAGLLWLLDGDTEVAPGIHAIRTGGHSDGHQIVRVAGTDATAVYWGDIVPTKAHVPYPWIMGYDLYPAETFKTKRRLYDRAIAEGWIAFFDHDPHTPAARLVRDPKGRPVAVDLPIA